MEIHNFKITNIGRFTELQILLAPTLQHSSNVTVLVGNNGAGKTTLLKSLATSLSWSLEFELKKAMAFIW